MEKDSGPAGINPMIASGNETRSEPVHPPVAVDPDDWETHWRQLANLTEINPADAYRERLVERALKIDGAGTGAAVLDAGCGSGTMLAHLARRHPEARLLGIDFSSSGLLLATRAAPQASFLLLDLAAGGADIPPRYRAWATHAICSEVIEHMDNPSAFLRKLQGWLTPDATLVVTVPAGPLAAYHHHVGHRRHYTPAALARVLDDAGFKVTRVQRAGFPFFTLYRMLTQMRGKKLLEDVATGPGGRQSLPLRIAFRLLRPCFSLNRTDLPLGWQIVAAARPKS